MFDRSCMRVVCMCVVVWLCGGAAVVVCDACGVVLSLRTIGTGKLVVPLSGG